MYLFPLSPFFLFSFFSSSPLFCFPFPFPWLVSNRIWELQMAITRTSRPGYIIIISIMVMIVAMRFLYFFARYFCPSIQHQSLLGFERLVMVRRFKPQDLNWLCLCKSNYFLLVVLFVTQGRSWIPLSSV